MLKVRFGVAPRVCRVCVVEHAEQPVPQEDIAESIIVCNDYPCELIEKQSENRKGC